MRVMMGQDKRYVFLGTEWVLLTACFPQNAVCTCTYRGTCIDARVCPYVHVRVMCLWCPCVHVMSVCLCISHSSTYRGPAAKNMPSS